MTLFWNSVAVNFALAASTGVSSPATCAARHWSTNADATSSMVWHSASRNRVAWFGFLDLGRDHDEIGRRPVGDESLGTTEQPARVDTCRGGADSQNVGAGSRLCDCDCRDRAPGGVVGKPALLLFRRAQFEQIRCDDIGVDTKRGGVSVAEPCELLSLNGIETKIRAP